jgi:hypothetical protein
LMAPTWWWSAAADHGDGQGSGLNAKTKDCGHDPAHDVVLDAARDRTTKVPLELLVVVDRTDLVQAQAIVTEAANSYTPLNIELVPTFVVQPLSGRDSAALLEQGRDFGASAGAQAYDAITIVTGVDVVGADGDYNGEAYCIAGVRFRSSLRSVMVSEAGYGPKRFPNRSPQGQLRRSAFVFVHELGHLLGARHEHGNCVEAIGPEDVTFNEEWLQPCTAMDGGNPQDAKFGTLEGLVIRGHALRFAR